MKRPVKQNVSEIIDALYRDPKLKSCFTHIEHIPARAARYCDFPDDLNPKLITTLKRRGIDKLYTHQRHSYDAAQKNENIVIVTPTASGKTVCYNIPVLQKLLADRKTKAVYLFPTKALAHDQTDELSGIINDSGADLPVFTYDGDTPSSIRLSARTNGRLIVTNPDMLHTGILPNHPKWVKLFENLKYVIIDEIHTYRGIFGSHVANVINRLKRIAAFYGSVLQFICCSATIGNPKSHCENIIGEPVTVIDDNGAPQGEKYFMLYNPPIIDAGQGIRRGTVLESEKLARRFIDNGVQTIIFARSRLRTELIAGYLHRHLPHLRNRIRAYRGGYLPNERRAIEQGLRSGDIVGVVSTNALELGIDIGSLEACIMAGYPGSIASVWQQAGRAGRMHRVSIAVLVASNNPLDQFLVQHHDYFFGGSPEEARIDPHNLFILMDQIKCAAFELPFSENDTFGGEPITDLLDYLVQHTILHFSGSRYRWASDGYPAENVSLRSAEPGNFVIINTTDTTIGDIEENRTNEHVIPVRTNRVIGEIDRASVPETVYENAIYIHQNVHYQVERLDMEGKKVFVRQVDGDYYTDAVTRTDIKILDVLENAAAGNYEKTCAEVLVRTMATKYKKIKFHTHENIGYGDIHLPPEEMHTIACAISFNENVFTVDEIEQRQQLLLSLGNSIRQLVPVHVLCDPHDIGTAEQLKNPENDKPTVYIYDKAPGGIGLAQRLYEILDDVLYEAAAVISRCTCKNGCPSCIGPADEVGMTTKKQVLELFTTIRGDS